jgi:hypothetical protein
MEFLNRHKKAIIISIVLLLLAAALYYFILISNQTIVKSVIGMDIKDSLIFEEKVMENKDAFLAKVKQVCSELGISPNWLMAVMYKESGVNPKAVNPNGGATGLIQFMPATAKGLGTTTQALYSMSNVDQLDYVKRYFQPYAKWIKSYADLYLVTFFPAALPMAENWIFHTASLAADTIGKANPAINYGKPIDKIAFSDYLFRNIGSSLKPYLV